MSRSFEDSRAETLSALHAFAQAETGVEAFWLQGSLATATADRFSDIDAYLAISDDRFESLWARRADVIAALGGALAWSDATTPGLTAIHALMAGGSRLDLFFERASGLSEAARPAAKVLIDKTGVAASVRLGREVAPARVGRTVQTIIRMTRQGATWPLRALGRGQWSSLAMMELDLINAQLAQLIAVRHDPANFYRNPFSVPLALSADERALLDDLTGEALRALTQRDASALKLVHLRLLDSLVAEGRNACAALGVDYPITVDGEAAIRALLDREWPT